jgi:hypothetical protein
MTEELANDSLLLFWSKCDVGQINTNTLNYKISKINFYSFTMDGVDVGVQAGSGQKSCDLQTTQKMKPFKIKTYDTLA